jgi:hypothetical protein
MGEVITTIVEDHLRERLGAGANLEEIRKAVWGAFVEALGAMCRARALASLDKGLADLGLVQRDLAEQLALDRSMVSRILSGTVVLSYQTLARGPACLEP